MEKTIVKLARIEEGVKGIKEDLIEIKKDLKERNVLCQRHSNHINVLRRDFKWVGVITGAVGSLFGMVIGIMVEWYNKKGG